MRARREGQHISAEVSRTLEPSMLKKRVKMKTVDDVIRLYIRRHEAACCLWWKDENLLQRHVKMEVFRTVVANMSSRSVDLSTVSPSVDEYGCMTLFHFSQMQIWWNTSWVSDLPVWCQLWQKSLPSEHFCEIVKKHNSKEKYSYQNGTGLLGFYCLLL